MRATGNIAAGAGKAAQGIGNTIEQGIPLSTKLMIGGVAVAGVAVFVMNK